MRASIEAVRARAALQDISPSASVQRVGAGVATQQVRTVPVRDLTLYYHPGGEYGRYFSTDSSATYEGQAMMVYGYIRPPA